MTRPVPVAGLTTALLAALVATAPRAAAAQETGKAPACPAAADSLVEAAWERYRAGAVEAAGCRFARAADRCPDHPGALVGSGYVALRRGKTGAAASRFRRVVEDDPENVDALVGLGLVAWREGEHDRVAELFRRVQRLDPERPEAREYLERLPEGLGPPPERPPLVRPDTVVFPARVRDGGFELRGGGSGWRRAYLRGVNLGAALPGRHPSQFPEAATYRRWIAAMAEMGVNVVRVYTIHPPAFYDALAEHNRAHPQDPLWLMHGVWTELPPDDDYRSAAFESGFFEEMHRVVDVVHGRADLRPRPGHASGHYTSDVSPWTAGWIIGREWEPYSVLAFDDLAPDAAGTWSGRYLAVEDGSPMEVWLARASEEIVAYEMERYHAQRPVAYTSWPTLDPLHHPTEASTEREVAIRRSLGETVERPPRELDNDAVSVDPTRMRATGELPAGVFAVYHAYPYYPDFMIFDPGYREARSPFGPSNYWGYLRELADHHGEMAVVIGEYGVPASLGSAHLQPQGWHHGGHTERSMAETDVRLAREIRAAGMAGGIVFAWIDEWFKKNWLVVPFEIPLERNRLWWNRMDAEQHYGMIAMEPEPAVAGGELAERRDAWADVAVLAERGGVSYRAAADEAYLWIFVESADVPLEEARVGFDVVRPEAGDRRWPGSTGLPDLPVGLEFVLRVDGTTARLVADSGAATFRVEQVRTSLPGEPVSVPIEEAPPGLFRGRVEQRFADPYVSRPNRDGAYDALRVVTNRPRFGRDSTEYAGMGYDRGVLRRGEPHDGQWQWSADRRALEVRVPWALLNVTDPSRRRVLQEGHGSEHLPEGGFGTVVVDDIGVSVAVRPTDGEWRWIRDPGEESVPRFTWPTWEEPSWRSRRRPVFDALRELHAEWDAPEGEE